MILEEGKRNRERRKRENEREEVEARVFVFFGELTPVDFFASTIEKKRAKNEKRNAKMSRRILQKLKAVDFYRKIPT